jgi:hypothetical protein
VGTAPQILAQVTIREKMKEKALDKDSSVSELEPKNIVS